MRRISILCFGLLALAGCGGATRPGIEASTADALARQADAVAARIAVGDACGARDHAVLLQRRTIAAINAGRVPTLYQRTLQSRANELVSALDPECLPTVAPARTTPPPEGVVKPWKHPHGRGWWKNHGQGEND